MAGAFDLLKVTAGKQFDLRRLQLFYSFGSDHRRGIRLIRLTRARVTRMPA